MDFIHVKQYSPINLFQFFQIADLRSVSRWRILTKHYPNFPHKFSIGFRSGLFTGHVIDFICLSWKKSFNPICSITRYIIILKNDFIITKLIFYRWDFNVYMCTDFEVMFAIITNNVKNDFQVFFRLLSSYVLMERHQNKSFSIIALFTQILHLSLDIVSI